MHKHWTNDTPVSAKWLVLLTVVAVMMLLGLAHVAHGQITGCHQSGWSPGGYPKYTCLSPDGSTARYRANRFNRDTWDIRLSEPGKRSQWLYGVPGSTGPSIQQRQDAMSRDADAFDTRMRALYPDAYPPGY